MIFLQGKTQKGKNRVRELGTEWKVLDTRDSVAFSSDSGPWVRVAPVSGGVDKDRWIHLTKDKDFSVTVTD